MQVSTRISGKFPIFYAWRKWGKEFYEFEKVEKPCFYCYSLQRDVRTRLFIDKVDFEDFFGKLIWENK